uniref:AMP-dependent synthetase/ligase domain-containing protein n=1 Tax=Arion vulgaris TaxID=1028688 RepID=A0A0B7B1E1_9EUPU
MGNIYMSPALDTIPKRINFLVENYPDRELFVFYQGGTRDPYTPKRLYPLAGKFAYRLRQKYGFQRNDVIANTLPNSPERLITDLGITLAGCVCLNAQILLADGSDFFQCSKNSRCRGIVLQPEEDVAAWRLLKSYVTGDVSSLVTELSCASTPDLTSAILVSRKSDGLRKPLLEDLRYSDDEVFVDSTISPDDVLYIFSTSGSTGYSKLVPRTHAEAFDMAAKPQARDENEVNEEFVFYSDRLLGWPGGFPFHTYCLGQKRVLLDWFDAHGGKKGGETWDTICKEKCSVICIFPLELDSILKHIANSGRAHSKVKLLVSGAQPLKKSHLAGMLSIAEQLLVGYGSTEVAPISTGIVKNTDVDDYFCGKPVAGMQLKVVDEKGEICPPHKTGTILLKGAGIFKGYFNRLVNPDPNTVKCFTKEGWFDTEDTGYLDDDGNVYVLGRNKDTIMYGSSVLYPGWLEAKIMLHPDVAEACVLPVSDPVLFHNICACVKKVIGSDLNEEKLKTYCESIFVADLENDLTPMPKFFMVFETLPETATGKMDKQKLRKMAEEKFGITKATSQQ